MKLGLDNQLFDWVNFATNFGLLFGFIPGSILYYIGVKNSILFGGVLLSLMLMLTSRIVNGDPDMITRNGQFVCVAICGTAGQAALLIFLATTQALLHHSTVIATAVINTALLVFYLGADSHAMIIFHDKFANWSFASFVEILAIKNICGQLLNYFLIIEPLQNFEYLQIKEIIRKGVFFKNIGFLQVLIAFGYAALIVISYYFGQD